MIYVLAILIFAALVWLGRRAGRPEKKNEWRAAAGIIGVGCVVAGVAASIRGLWLAGAILLGAGLSLSLIARRTPLPFTGMSEGEARGVLGVGAEATNDQIQAAYRARMRTAHPDQGGDAALAKRLNAARDRLLKHRQA